MAYLASFCGTGIRRVGHANMQMITRTHARTHTKATYRVVEKSGHPIYFCYNFVNCW